MYMWCLPHVYVRRFTHVHVVSCGLQQTHRARLREEVTAEGR